MNLSYDTLASDKLSTDSNTSNFCITQLMIV